MKSKDKLELILSRLPTHISATYAIKIFDQVFHYFRKESGQNILTFES